MGKISGKRRVSNRKGDHTHHVRAPKKSVLIDAAAALRILMSPKDKKADPHKQADFIKERARNGRLRMWGLRGYATVSEPIPVEHACTLKFAWNTKASEMDDQLGQLDLVAVSQLDLVAGLAGEPVWCNVHFYQHEIEADRPNFRAWLKNAGAELPARRRVSPERDEARRALKALFRTGVPNQAALPNKQLCDRVRDWLKAPESKLSDKTIRRAAGRK